MQCYTELAPPTAVSHSLNLPFVAPKANNLIIAKSSLLQVFELKSTVTEVAPGSNGDLTNASHFLDSETADLPLQRIENTSKLILIAEYPLAGTVTSLARIKALGTKSGGEALLISFRDAKLSLVEWDPEFHNLSTISIHYYEGQSRLDEPWSPDLKDCNNFLTADPSSRCAALKFGVRSLAILPFRQHVDDLAGEDSDSDLDSPVDRPSANGKAVNGVTGDSEHRTPYSSSFVLPLTVLDPTLTHPIHLAFLHEYREPTFGVISSSRAPSGSLLVERRDVLTYSVFTLDLEQKASTTLLSISGLPYDIFRVVPLPKPVGGALLLGGNEIIHIDQGGKTNGVAVNEFAKVCTSFPLVDQTDLGLRLEGCTAELLSNETGDVVIVLQDGVLLTLSFSLDGRSVSGMTLHRVLEDQGGRVLASRASCVTNLGRGKIFVGSEDGESVLMGWTSKVPQLSRKRSNAELFTGDGDSSLDEEDLDDLDDDLYGDDSPVKKATTSVSGMQASGSYIFRVHDVLPSLAPIKDVAFANSASQEASTQTDCPLEIMASTGRGKGGGITMLKRDVDPVPLKHFNVGSGRGLWSVHARKPAPKGVVSEGAQDSEGNMAADAAYDQYLVVCKAGENGNEDTIVYEIDGTDIEETSKGDFEREDGSTMDVGTLANGTKVVQVLRNEIRTYDSELNMEQILPMEDEDSGAELRIISTSFADPYLLVLRDDSSVKLFKATDGDDIEEMENEGISKVKWMSACLYRSTPNVETHAFLLTPEGCLRAYDISDLEGPSYSADGLGFLPPTLTAEYAPRRSSAKAVLTELLVADIGDRTSKSPHLLVRTANDDLNIYKPFHSPSRSASDPFTKNLRWLKLSQQHLPKYTEEPAMDSEDAGREGSLMAVSNIGGYSTVFQRGTSPSFVLKESSSAPKVLILKGKAVKGLTPFHTAACEQGFAYIDADNNLSICQLPAQTRYGDLGWAARKVSLGQEVHAVDYHPKGVFVLGSGQMTDFTLPEDSYHYEWAREDTAFKPQVEQGMVRLMDAGTFSIIDTHTLDPHEVILCIKTLNLEVSEATHERKYFMAVGTAIIQGEDLATKGRIHIFEVITVVPEPGRPETNRKLRLIAKEEVKGAVTAVSGIGSQGFLIMAQGQKCMVRGLKEDGTLLPVAFLDMNCYTTVLKELKGTGMLLMGDAFKGISFTGYTEEPYKMLSFGRGRTTLEVLAGDFLPFQRTLHFLIADSDSNLHVLQYDPEHPKSLSGQRLLHKTTFHTGHFPTGLHLLRSTSLTAWAGNDETASPPPGTNAMDIDQGPPLPLHHVLHTTTTGSLGLITPLPEQTYRRLSALATFLANTLESPCGLNPRGYRNVENEGFASRGIVDGALLRRWGELGEQRRREGLVKVGLEEWVLRGDLEILGGGAGGGLVPA